MSYIEALRYGHMMSLHSQHYPRSSVSDDQSCQSNGVCVCMLMCVYTSEMDRHREGWTGEAIV